LSCIAIALQGLGGHLKWSYNHNDIRKPILVVELNLPGKKVARIFIRTTISSDLFKQDKLLPDRNNVRSSPNATESSSLSVGTPAYNSSLLFDTTLLSHLHDFHLAASKATALTDAIKLIKVWCEQRQLYHWSFVLSYIAAQLVLSRQISGDFKALQIFKVVFFFIGNHNFSSNPLSFADESCAIFDYSTVEVAVVDKNGVNLTYWASLSDCATVGLI
jgi:hypothetical protein